MLLPYFVCAAGLYSLGTKQNGTAMIPVYLRQPRHLYPEVSPELDATGPSSNMRSADEDSPHVKLSAAAYARLLLSKIATTNRNIVIDE